MPELPFESKEVLKKIIIRRRKGKVARPKRNCFCTLSSFVFLNAAASANESAEKVSHAGR